MAALVCSGENVSPSCGLEKWDGFGGHCDSQVTGLGNSFISGEGWVRGDAPVSSMCEWKDGGSMK